jgi:hypothetical protein
MNVGNSNNLSSLQDSYYRNYLLLFLLWPFIAFLTALLNYSHKESKKIVYIFLIYYGLTFVLGNAGNDAERYAMQMQNYADLPFSDFFKIVGGLYTSDTSVDIIEPFISFIVSRISTYPGFLFSAYAALFGFFYLKSINLLHDLYKQKPGINALMFLILFIVIEPIWAINGFRMWTAAWIFFYGAYHVVLYRDPKYLILSMASSLVHFSFLSANGILIIYFIAGNRNIVYLPLALTSFILPKIIMPVFQSFFGILGGALKNRAEMYSSEAVIQGRQAASEQVAWFMQMGNDLILYYLLLAIIVIQIKQRNLTKEPLEKNLFSFMLLFLAFVNFAKEIPSFGGRFQIIFFMLATLYIFLYLFKQNEHTINVLTLIGLFPICLYAAIAFRQGCDSINAWILAPGLGLPFFVPGISLADLLFN